MKLKYLVLSLVLLMVYTCDNDDDNAGDYELVQVATPQKLSKSDFRNSIEINDSKQIEQFGKIYAYQNYIFISDVHKGVHVIDNSNPNTPKAVKFIKILANEDISVKNNFLYADSATDLVVFDISDMNNITLVERLEDVFSVYDSGIPIEAEVFEYKNFDNENEIIVSWALTTERRKKPDEFLIDETMWLDSVSLNSGNSTGTGGSLARFQIVEDYLYAVGNQEMAIFNISNLSEPVLSNMQYAGWNIETMFQADNYLYLGSTNGMYIYSLENPSLPEYVSEFTHWEGCDPVVVDGNFAYLTLRGGNDCGQLESVLEVIDVTNKSNPVLASRYKLENPYGLGVKGNTLFVCDGTAGLKLFNKTNPLEMSISKTYNNIQSKDVIPMENKLLMIGGNTLYQYKYLEDGLELISTFSMQ